MRARALTLLVVVPALAAGQQSSIVVAPIEPPAFRLLADPAVTRELGLTAAQRAAYERVTQAAEVPPQGIPLDRFGRVPPEAVAAAANRRIASFLADELTKDQRARLEQIRFQLREREFGPHQAFAMAARDLGLRPDQLEDVRSLKGQRVEDIAKAVTSGKRFEKVKTEVEAANGETFTKMAEMLTRAQRERLAELRGKPFTPKAEVAVGVTTRAGAKYPAPKLGLYDLELDYLDKTEVRKELGLSDEQGRKLVQAWIGFLAFKSGAKVIAGREVEAHEYTEKALTDILTADQRARFDQLMMQRRARVGPEAVCSHPAAVATLKLSPIQLKDLAIGKSLDDVLTRAQLDKFKSLLGEPYTLPEVNDRYAPEPAPRFGKVVTYAQARDFLKLSDRLQLTDEQVKKLRELAEDEPKVRELIQKELSLDDTPPVAGAGRALTAVNAVTTLYREAVEHQCWEVLDPQQQSAAKRIFGRGRK